MSTVTITRRRITRDVRRGDTLVAVDGRPLPHPARVTARPDARGVVPLRNPLGTAVEWRLYPDSQVERDITVERPEPRPAVRYVDGVRLTRTGYHGGWVTDDRRYEVFEHDGYLTECDNPHPARVADYQRDAVQTGAGYPVPEAAESAIWAGRSHYQCPGGEEHTYSLWVVWDFTRDDYLGGDTGGDSTFGAAAARLAGYLRGKG